jgi:hypothetical protein
MLVKSFNIAVFPTSIFSKMVLESSDHHFSGTLHAGRSRAALSSRPDGATDEIGAEASGYVGGDEQLGQVASGLGCPLLWIKDIGYLMGI